jgi:hypothetical protein
MTKQLFYFCAARRKIWEAVGAFFLENFAPGLFVVFIRLSGERSYALPGL